MTKTTTEEADMETILIELRRRRDEAARIGDHAEALILNDRINDLKDGRSSATVERVMRQFESALVRKRRHSLPQ